MQLATITEARPRLFTLYKGLSLFSGYAKYKHRPRTRGTAIPGFLASWHLARTYSEPNLTSPDDEDPSIIIAVRINPQEVEDRTAAFLQWCQAQGQPPDISMGYPKEWRQDHSIWTVNCQSSAHGTQARMSCFSDADFVYCGVSKPYTVIRHYNNQAEWEQDTQQP